MFILPVVDEVHTDDIGLLPRNMYGLALWTGSIVSTILYPFYLENNVFNCQILSVF